jgi:uncharacterized MAPEG superfamily protein
MTIPLWCLLAAIILPYAWTPVALSERKAKFGNVDNQHPRQQTSQLEGKGARAYAAHQNAMEALAVFAPAVLVSHVTHANLMHATYLSAAWVVVRVLHGVFYITNTDKARSMMFAIGMLCVVGLFVISAMAAGAPAPH